MTLGKPSKEIFLPALPKIGSQNETMIQDSLSPSPDDETKGGFMETDLTSRINGKRVHFSQPLEFWKEFDRDSGQLLDETEGEETVKKTADETKERERKSYEDKVSKKLNEREKRRGKARIAHTITEAVESLRLEDEKTSVRKFIAHYKRSTANDYRLQNKPAQRGIVCEEENQPFIDGISDSTQHENKATTRRLCKLCKCCNKRLVLDSKPKRNSKCCSKTIRLKQKPRASSLPGLDVNGRKLFEERLLPDDLDHDKCTLKNHVKYGCYGAAFRGGTSVTYLTPTPLIVQLFE